VLTALDDKVAELRRKPDEVCAKFASKYLRTQQDNPKDIRSRVCPADAFELLADAMYRPREEDEAYITLQGRLHLLDPDPYNLELCLCNCASRWRAASSPTSFLSRVLPEGILVCSLRLKCGH
jgi:hypothetical protein